MHPNLFPLASLPAHASVEAALRPIDLPAAACPAQLVLIRGLPGSGKSTLARAFADAGYQHCEADQFFTRNGQYRYQPSLIRDAHTWCQAQTRDALRRGRRVVVANTFTRLSEMNAYLSMSQDIVVVHARGMWPNVHDVPQDVVRRMADRWEPLARAALRSGRTCRKPALA